MDPEFAGFIGTGGHDPPGVRIPSHDDGFAPQLGVIPLFDGGVERIHVDVDDLARRWHHVSI
jgi:hypothetical protein